MTLRTFAAFMCVFQFALQGSSDACDACKFVADESADCKVYGQLGDDILIAWSRASQACLDVHNIKVESVNPALLESAFPEGSAPNVIAFVNMLRFEGSTAVINGIRLSLTDLFEEEGNGISVLKDMITVKGVTYDCEASESDCWNKGVREYFSMEPGASEMVEIGEDLYNRQRLDKELEQSTVRIAICNSLEEGSDSTCEPLLSEVEDKKSSSPDKACSAFGLGPAENTIPGCDGVDENSNVTNDGPSSNAFEAKNIYYGTILLILLDAHFW